MPRAAGKQPQVWASLKNEMDTDYCENMQPNVAGATGAFMVFINGLAMVGAEEEQWILHPTEAWTSTEGETCYVTWAINAQQEEAAGCPSCCTLITPM